MKFIRQRSKISARPVSTRILRYKKCTRIAILVLVSLTSIGATATPALAVTVPTALPLSQYTLEADYHKLDALNAALTGKLATAAVHTVMDYANHDRSAITDDQVLALPGYRNGFKFDAGDNTDCTKFPQGVTSSRDAVGTANGGRYDGRQLILVSWRQDSACGGTTSRSLITLAD